MSQLVLTFSRNFHLIDGHDLGLVERTGTYVLDCRPEGNVTIIETGPSISNEYIKKGLEEIGIPLSDIQWIIVTHIHLDHAGGAGLLLNDCPNAKVVVHPRGYRHLCDPSRLIKGAKAVYGAAFDDLFAPILPIAKDRLVEKADQSTLSLTDDRTLTFIDTPGHAKHHYSIYDTETATMFTGDTIGIRYPSLERDNVSLYLPSTSPNQFNPEDMLNSLAEIKSFEPKQIAFGHFGISDQPSVVYEQIRYWLSIFMEKGQEVFDQNQDHETLQNILLNEVNHELKKQGISPSHSAYQFIHLDLKISAMGILDYLS
ncbi:MBL fold metallo-hydrolase [Bacillus shivajii]|uniref:MBL fold metallo-hydrolase n=1 Tax=Bacillus shivajii TaxID=1983719 RepID=UPI001CF9918D|nr:MBL fold metallo-hydrolase [Bacillus shivajii]UCZ54845.1 MBL fold metallo-hydrolase [Bacillus shivajii]